MSSLDVDQTGPQLVLSPEDTFFRWTLANRCSARISSTVPKVAAKRSATVCFQLSSQAAKADVAYRTACLVGVKQSRSFFLVQLSNLPKR